MSTIKLSEYAKMNAVTWRTAFSWFQEGKIPSARKTPGGSIVVDVEDDQSPLQTITYARVSNSGRKNTDLVRQHERLLQFCQSQGWEVSKSFKEVSSGLNDNRRELNKILDSPRNIRLVIEHKDRLTRFGFHYIERLLKTHGSEIVVINQKEDEEDLVEDLVSIITSFCARIYGRRRAERKVVAITEVLNNENTD